MGKHAMLMTTPAGVAGIAIRSLPMLEFVTVQAKEDGRG